MTNTADAFVRAFQCHQAGNLREARQLYEHVLRLDPGNADAHHLFGVLVYQLGDYDQAQRSISLALTLNPRAALYYSNLGMALEALGRVEEAAGAYRQALSIQPDFPEAHCNLGKALQQLGKLEEAIVHTREAIRLSPHYTEAHNNLGNALLRQEKLEDAVASFHRALQTNPNFAKAYNNLGTVLDRQEKLDEAIDCFRQALRIEPNFAEAYDNLGISHGRKGDVDEAIQCFQAALQLSPHSAQAHYNLGCALMDHGRPDQAVGCFEQALRLEPNRVAAQSNVLFCLNYDPQADADAVFEAHCRWGRLHEPATPPLPHANDRDPERRLRIGYVSPDFRGHALARYLEPVLANHDPHKVEVFCYAEVPRADAITASMQKLAHGWRPTSRLTDAQVAEQIRRDRIDILVDLAGHTRNSRLLVFADKPAPVQATWLGYMNTTGLTAVDYRLTDDFLDPPDQPVRDTEELVRLPGGMCCFAAPQDTPPVGPPPSLEAGHLTFGSLHNLFKLNSRVFDLWSRVLQAVPESRLLMFHHTLTGTARDQVLRQFTQRGIASNRLDLRRGSSTPGYLKIYREIDVSLDVFPCTGGVTTCESLWMGAPVLTLCGIRPAGRNAAAILTRLGLEDWAVQTADQYVALAEGLGSASERLGQLRSTLRQRMMATLCDARRFTGTLEDAFRTMWRRWCAKQV